LSSPSPPGNDPLAALAHATQKAVHSEQAARAAALQAREEEASGRKRAMRFGAAALLLAIIAIVLVVQVPRMGNPYHGSDPLSDPRQAKAYVAALLDGVMEWRARHSGELPSSLEQAVPANRLLPAGSSYRLEYKNDHGVPVLTLHGGPQPVMLRGDGK
jgi:hypothetical protein